MSRRLSRMRADVRSWSRRHGYSLLSSIGSLVRHPLNSLLTIAVLALALALPLGLYMALDNLRQVNQNLERLDSLSVFLHIELDEANARRLGSRISAWESVLAVDPISPEAGMRELSGAIGLPKASGSNSATAERPDLGLAEVGLPWVLEITPADRTSLDTLSGRLDELEEVDLVVIDLDWVRRLDALLAIFLRLVEIMAVVFALTVLFVISNNIRTEVQQRREEIEVLAMVGATPGYIRRPFLYAGLWMGLAGALLAWLLVVAGLWLLGGPVGELAASYATPIMLAWPSPNLVGGLLAGSGLLGIIGAWIAVSHQLLRINP
ncbi:MAG: permease-like cell division protein FtsX [Xanthomonadaceae bacterium]|nr:permease-like cell division protein FtsX [Xanthomonadaceae bacterium]